MDNQTAYLAVRAHFSAPGADFSRDDHGDCYYRHPEDLAAGLHPERVRKCAAGCLMPDDLYDKVQAEDDIEGTAWNSVVDKLFAIDPDTMENLFGNVDVELMNEMQHAHDNSNDIPTLILRLDQIAYNYHLKVPA